MNVPGFDTFDRVWFLSWTTYGTWLPGDERGFVSPKFDGGVSQRRNNNVGTPYDSGRADLRRIARAKLVGGSVGLTFEMADRLQKQFDETADYRGWTIVAGAIMQTHLHLVVGVHGDPDPSTLMRDFKAYGSRPLNRIYGKPLSGTWWTEQGSKRKVKNERHYRAVVKYVLKQPGALVIWSYGERGA